MLCCDFDLSATAAPGSSSRVQRPFRAAEHGLDFGLLALTKMALSCEKHFSTDCSERGGIAQPCLYMRSRLELKAVTALAIDVRLLSWAD